ncbi:nitrogen assimilation transcriptional activator [Reticulibacter mediterranei]|uniref:Nitrogen assimilation transcriptional activator n=1 Tax=Reticulibacter mediterranei TaxID=2778369 RepID=A0A8J3N763_9CHLR|nr:LysR family transcriptional regulator [Reticulibacter mediterranei]GHO96827.1 nitrogen assimilation transcriptional activator [Reticulibacter mediterranei]
MDIEQLQAFDRIVRDGSFSRAARALNIAQPTISARIQGLEQVVGGTLFVRGGRSIVLTELGESFLPYARRALAVLTEGIEVAQGMQTGAHGRVTVGTIQSLAGGFLASSIQRFHNAYPQVEFFVRTGHSDQVVEMLYDGLVKLGLVSWPFFNLDLKLLQHFREPLVFVVGAEHPLASKRSIKLDEVHKVKGHLLKVRWGYTTSEFESFLENQASPMIDLPIDTVRYMLLRGIGGAFLVRALVADDLATGHLIEVVVEDFPTIYRESALVCLQKGAMSTALHNFVDVLREEAGELAIKSEV